MKKKSTIISFLLLIFLLFITYFSIFYINNNNFLRLTKESQEENENSLEKCKNGKKKIYNNFIQGNSIIFSKYIDSHQAESYINYDLKIETNKKKNFTNFLKRYGPYLFFGAIGFVVLICWFLYFCCLSCGPKCCFVHNSKKDSGVRKYSYVISIVSYCGLICCCVSGIIFYWKTKSNVNSCECCIERFYYDFEYGEIKENGKRFIGFDSIIQKFNNIKDFINKRPEIFELDYIPCYERTENSKLLSYYSKIRDLKILIDYIKYNNNTIRNFIDDTISKINNMKNDFKSVNIDYVEKFKKYSKKYFTKFGKFFLALFFLITLIISILIIILESKYVFGENQGSLKSFLILLFNISALFCIYSFVLSSILGIFSYFTSDLITYINYSVEKDDYKVISNENSFNLIQYCLNNDGNLNNYLEIDKGMTNIFNMIFSNAKFIINANSDDIINIRNNNDDSSSNNENRDLNDNSNSNSNCNSNSNEDNFDKLKDKIIEWKTQIYDIFNDYIINLNEDDLGDDLFGFCNCSFIKRNLNLTYESYYDLKQQIVKLTTIMCFTSFFLLFGGFCLLFNIFHFNKKYNDILHNKNNNLKIGKGFRFNNYDEKTNSERKNINEKSESDSNTYINNLGINSNNVNMNKINNNNTFNNNTFNNNINNNNNNNK